MGYCQAVYKVLTSFFGENLVRSYTPIHELPWAKECTFDVIKPSIAERFKSKGLSMWIPSYGTASLFVFEDNVEGDTVVPSEKSEEVQENLRKIGATLLYVHRHEQFTVDHIHFRASFLKTSPERLAETISG